MLLYHKTVLKKVKERSSLLDFLRLFSANDTLFPEAFALYVSSFPQHEQRTVEKQASVMYHPLYHFDVILDQGGFAGILLHWDLTGCTYIEHFAIHPSLRGQSIGSKSLSVFCEKHASVVLEIDPPVDEVSIRRRGFYERLGFLINLYSHVHPAYRAEFPPHALTVMSYGKLLTEEDFRLFRQELSDIVMKDAKA